MGISRYAPRARPLRMRMRANITVYSRMYLATSPIVYSISDVQCPVMSSGCELRLHEQLRAVWKSRDKTEPIVRGYLLRGSDDAENKSDAATAERWFVLLGHFFFYTVHRDSPEYSGALLVNVFRSVTLSEDGETLRGKSCTLSHAESKVYRDVCMHSL